MKSLFSLCHTGTFPAFATLPLLCLLLLCASPAAHAGSDDLPTPGWSFTCRTPFQACSVVEVYRYWGEKPGERLPFAVEAHTKDVNNKNFLAVWLLMDEPDVEFVKELGRADMTVFVVRPRGTKLSTTHYTCPDAGPTNSDQCWLTEKCVAELAARSAKKDDLFNASHFSADQVARDVEWLLRTVGDGRRNVILAQGLSTIFATRLLQLFPSLPVGAILMDPVNPPFFDTYGYLGGTGYDVALQHLLAMCDDSTDCVGRLGAMEGSWSRLQTLMGLARNNKLTCSEKLNWSGSKQLGSSFADQLRSVLALMLRFPTYPYIPSKTDLSQLIPSMLYRLQRCSDKDIKALNKLYTYVTDTKNHPCPTDVPVQTHWLVNEYLQTAAPKNAEKYWAGEAAGRLVLPPLAHTTDFHAIVAKMPSVPRTAASKMLPVNATQKVLFLSADLDAMAPRGAASRAAISFKSYGSAVKAVQLRGVANAPAAALTPCLINNLQYFGVHQDWAEADKCTMDSVKRVDFLAGNTKDYYGEGDGWDFDMPNDDDGSSRSSGGGESSHISVLKAIFRVVLILVVLAALGFGGFVGYNYLKVRGFRYNRVSDNFYDNLQT